jgi:hypothetical protein
MARNRCAETPWFVACDYDFVFERILSERISTLPVAQIGS